MDFVIGLIPREVAFAFSAVAESLNVTVQGTLAVGCRNFFFPFLFKNFWLPAFYAYLLLLLSCRALMILHFVYHRLTILCMLILQQLFLFLWCVNQYLMDSLVTCKFENILAVICCVFTSIQKCRICIICSSEFMFV